MGAIMGLTIRRYSSLVLKVATLRMRRRAPRLALSMLIVTTASAWWAPHALGESITTRSYDNARTGWNQHETVLTPSNVNPSMFHKIGELPVDDKIEASPLFIENVSTSTGPRDLLIVTTTNASVYAFDAKTNATVWFKSLANSVPSLKPAVYERWGITSTPVVDPDTNTLYVVRLAWEQHNGTNHKIYRLHGLELSDGNDVIQPQVIDGFTVKRHSKFFRNGEQLLPEHNRHFFPRNFPISL